MKLSYLINTNLNINQYIKWIFYISLTVSLSYPLLSTMNSSYVELFELFRIKSIISFYSIKLILTLSKYKKTELNKKIILYKKEVKALKWPIEFDLKYSIKDWRSHWTSKHSFFMFPILLFLRIYLWWFLLILTIFYCKLILEEFKLFYKDSNKKKWIPECKVTSSYTTWNHKYILLSWFIDTRDCIDTGSENAVILNYLWRCFSRLTFEYQCNKAFLIVYSFTKFFYNKKSVEYNRSPWNISLTTVYTIIRLILIYILRILGLPFKMSLEMFEISICLSTMPKDIKESGLLNKKVIIRVLSIVTRRTNVCILDLSVYRDDLNPSIIIWNPLTDRMNKAIKEKKLQKIILANMEDKNLVFGRITQKTEGTNKSHPEILITSKENYSGRIITQKTHNANIKLIEKLEGKSFFITKCSDSDRACFGINTRFDDKIISDDGIILDDYKFINSYGLPHFYQSVYYLNNFDNKSEVVIKFKKCVFNEEVKEFIAHSYDISPGSIKTDFDLSSRVRYLGFAESNTKDVIIITDNTEAIKKATKGEDNLKFTVNSIDKILKKNNSNNNKFKLIMKELDFNPTALDKDINFYNNNEE